MHESNVLRTLILVVLQFLRAAIVNLREQSYEGNAAGEEDDEESETESEELPDHTEMRRRSGKHPSSKSRTQIPAVIRDMLDQLQQHGLPKASHDHRVDFEFIDRILQVNRLSLQCRIWFSHSLAAPESGAKTVEQFATPHSI